MSSSEAAFRESTMAGQIPIEKAADAMRPFHTVLFPVDFSQAAIAMVPYVTEMVQRFNGTVTVLNAFDLVRDYVLAPPSEASCESERAAPIPYVPALQELRKQRQHRIEEFTRTHFAGVQHTARIEDGDPAAVIEWVAQRENADLIMMPTRGLGKFRRLLLGSVTAKVLHDASRPVLTSAHDPEPGLAPTTGYRSILCAVELNQEANRVLRTAGFLARTYGATLCLVHMEPSSRRDDAEVSAESLRQVLQHAMVAESGVPGVGTKVRVLDADVPEGIRVTAIEVRADLVVVGRGHEKGNFSRMWSHLYTIIRESPCPVLSV
jgi:nucleotide-binding universal stress UspA family protein